MSSTRCLPAWVILTAVWAWPCPAAEPDYTYDKAIDAPMYRDPDLPAPRTIRVLPEGARELWIRALGRPEVEVRVGVATDIARAHRRGMKGLKAAAIGPLQAVLNQSDEHPAVLLAVVQALVTMDARESAPSLLRAARSGSRQVRELAEPALARWEHAPAGPMWLDRLGERATSQRDLLLAVRGLGALREEKAAGPLRELVFGYREPGRVRVEAARALGLLRGIGLEEDAGRLIRDETPLGLFSRLAAVALLSRHESPEAVRLLQPLIRAEPAVGALAAGRLLAIDPQQAVPVLDLLLVSRDPNVRSRGVEVLLRTPSEKHLRLLGDRLDDPHPEVRKQARRALHELSSRKEWRGPVVATATDVLGGDRWRALEQAAILLTLLDHKPTAARLVELLAFDRPEVFVSAAWGLRKLAVPEALPGVLRYTRAEQARLLESERLPGRAMLRQLAIDHQLSQLNQFLGREKYRPADGMLRKFVPRRDDKPIGPETRAAALWALGKIHEGEAVDELTTAARERVADTLSVPPEDTRVGLMAAILIGRMRARSALEMLREHCPVLKPTTHSINNACGWAISRITGEKMAPPETRRGVDRDWFLSPNQ